MTDYMQRLANGNATEGDLHLLQVHALLPAIRSGNVNTVRQVADLIGDKYHVTLSDELIDAALDTSGEVYTELSRMSAHDHSLLSHRRPLRVVAHIPVEYVAAAHPYLNPGEPYDAVLLTYLHLHGYDVLVVAPPKAIETIALALYHLRESSTAADPSHDALDELDQLLDELYL